MHVKKETIEAIYETIEILRNGAMITGQDTYTYLYRQRCLERAYLNMCQILVPEFIRQEWIKENTNNRIACLTDVSVLDFKALIRPEDSGQRRWI